MNTLGLVPRPLLCAVAALVSMTLPAHAAAACRPEVPPAFTAAQAQGGRVVYNLKCASCHGVVLQGGSAPTLKGPAFAMKWRSKSVGDLYGYILDLMPQDDPGVLKPTQAKDVTALILSSSALKPGSQALSATGPLAQACTGLQPKK